jgi:hypothetical protein
MRERVASERPVTQGRDTPARWTALETIHRIHPVVKASTRFLELERLYADDADLEVRPIQLADLIGEDNLKNGQKTRRMVEIFGPAQSSRSRGPDQRVYLWREVRDEARRQMASRLIQRLARVIVT